MYLAFCIWIIFTLNNMTWNWRFFNLADIDIKSFTFTFNSYNPNFTKLEIWYRILFLALNVIILIAYTHSLSKFSLRDWSIEQKWMFILLRSLLFFNNPIFSLNVLVDSWIPATLDGIFQYTFFALLMIFWLSLYHGIRQSDRNFLTFYVPKFAVVFFVWLLLICILLWQQFNSINDPTYNVDLDEAHYMVFRVLLFLFLTAYLLFLLYLVVRAFAELKNMPYFDQRLKFSVILMLFTIVIMSLITLLRLRSEVAFRQNLFENFTKNYRNTVEFCTIFSLFNIYIFTLSFVYSPAKNASKDNQRGNVTFSMLNDTDEEDIVYKSDELNTTTD